MSDCGCKNKNNDISIVNDPNASINLIKNGGNYLIKIIMFSITLIALPLILPLMVWFLFKTIVLNKSIDFMGFLVAVGKMLKKDKNDNDDINEINPNDYTLVGFDDLSKK